MKSLLSHPVNLTDSYKVEYEAFVENSNLIVEYNIQAKLDWNCSNSFSSDYFKNWGLWDFDVFEIFVQDKNQSQTHYTEFQVSPLNQCFCLEIVRPREIFFTPLEKEFYSEVELNDNKWSGKLIIPVSKNSDLYIGVFSMLGINKEFFSNNPNQGKPDFHRPELFMRL